MAVSTGEPPGRGAAGLRAVLCPGLASVPITGMIFFLVDVMWTATPARRALHDVLAGTVVVDVRSDGTRAGVSVPTRVLASLLMVVLLSLMPYLAFMG
ncbi:hypothetical protein ACFOWE_33720 [Planomonospora corallina]|uniref:RDD domain-containing protein n=1 Tax=Planomonospora corallina TaxID=1806052 RepID=A0ABV8IJX1_9ACTN